MANVGFAFFALSFPGRFMTSWFLCNDAKDSYWQYRFSGIRSYRISSAVIGVDRLTGVIMVAVKLVYRCFLYSLSQCVRPGFRAVC